jgi:hypothetical protein
VNDVRFRGGGQGCRHLRHFRQPQLSGRRVETTYLQTQLCYCWNQLEP